MFFSGCFEFLKKEQILYFNEILLKNGKNYFEFVISPSFNKLHCSTIVNMNQSEHMFQDLPFYCTKKVPKNHNQYCHFCHGGETHFLVLAQTLIYRMHLWEVYFLVLVETQILTEQMVLSGMDGPDLLPQKKLEKNMLKS